MSWYTIAVVPHVVVAVLGVGQVGAIVASSTHRSGMARAQAATRLAPLLRYTRWSLAVMLGTGIWLTISRVLRGEGDAAAAFRRVERAAWSMSGLVAVIAVLIEAKPF